MLILKLELFFLSANESLPINSFSENVE